MSSVNVTGWPKQTTWHVTNGLKLFIPNCLPRSPITSPYLVHMSATRNKCIATRSKGLASSNKKLLETRIKKAKSKSNTEQLVLAGPKRTSEHRSVSSLEIIVTLGGTKDCGHCLWVRVEKKRNYAKQMWVTIGESLHWRPWLELRKKTARISSWKGSIRLDLFRPFGCLQIQNSRLFTSRLDKKILQCDCHCDCRRVVIQCFKF